MNEIEKMYKNCNLLKPQAWSCKLDRIKFSGVCCELIKKGLHCSNCEYSKQEYYHPPFTAEKQLELIKWLIYYELIDYLKMAYISEEEEGYLSISVKCMSGYSYKNYDDDDFDIALASLINGLWEDLPENDKQQIKEILK